MYDFFHPDPNIPTLVEFFCLADDLVYLEFFNCPNGCKDGACITCHITNIYAEKVPGYVYYNLFISAENLPQGDVFGIIGAESWDTLQFEVADDIQGIYTILKATQTINSRGIDYILERKDNISLTIDGNVICK